jgi:hypothetical protein
VFQKAQKRHRDAASHELMRKKVVQVRKRGYVSAGPVISGTHYFLVPKGLDDICMVYNGSSCGLNDVLWAPRFGLPTVKQTLRALLPGYLQCDLDIGEQLLLPSRGVEAVFRGGCLRGPVDGSRGRRLGGRAGTRSVGAVGTQLDGPPRLSLSEPTVAGPTQV